MIWWGGLKGSVLADSGEDQQAILPQETGFLSLQKGGDGRRVPPPGIGDHALAPSLPLRSCTTLGHHLPRPQFPCLKMYALIPLLTAPHEELNKLRSEKVHSGCQVRMSPDSGGPRLFVDPLLPESE